MIASFVAIMPTRPVPQQAPPAERLAEMLAVRRQLTAEKVAAENASRLLEDAAASKAFSPSHCAGLPPISNLLDRQLVEVAGTDAALAHRYRLLTSMPGVGAVLACTLIALLPELGRLSRKQAAALQASPYSLRAARSRTALHPGRSCQHSPSALRWRDVRN